MGDVVRLTTKPRVVYYIELFQETTNPRTLDQPFKRLGPFERPIAFTKFMTFENGVDDDDIGLHANDNDGILYRAQPDDERLKVISMARMVAEVIA